MTTPDTIPARSSVAGAALAGHYIQDGIAVATIPADATIDEEHRHLEDVQSQVAHQLLSIEGVDAVLVFHVAPNLTPTVLIAADRSELTRALMEDYHFARSVSLTPTGDLSMYIHSHYIKKDGMVKAQTVAQMAKVIRGVARKTARHPENKAEVAVLAAAMQRTQLLVGRLAATTVKQSDVPKGAKLRDVETLPARVAAQIQSAEPENASAVVVFYESASDPRMAIYTSITDLAERMQEILLEHARELTVTEGDVTTYGEGKGRGRIIIGCKSNRELAALRDASMPKIVDAAVEHERKCEAAIRQARVNSRPARPTRATSLVVS